MFADYCKARAREKGRLGAQSNCDGLLTFADPAQSRADADAEAREELERFIDHLPESSRAIVKLLLQGHTYDHVGRVLKITAAEVEETIQRIEWPKGFRPAQTSEEMISLGLDIDE